MDYEKKYKEALEIVRAYYNRTQFSSIINSQEEKETIERAFPELAESEDERIRKHIIEILERLAPCHFDGNEKSECIAYLERQKEQKPAEWGEEDEAAFGDLMWCIEQARKSAKDENDMGNVWFAENWVKNRLKSLRPQPHWKPSEEQMDMLEYYMHALICTKNKEILFGLYNDLKKLM